MMTFDEWWDTKKLKYTKTFTPEAQLIWDAVHDEMRSQVLRYQEIIDKCREKIDTLEGRLYNMSERQGE